MQNEKYSEMRQRLKLQADFDGRFQVRLARSEAEMRAALTIVHDAYVTKGFMKANAARQRVTEYHFSKDTFMVNAYWNNRVVGTLTIILDGKKKVPMETLFDLDAFRQNSKKFAEVSSLAILPDFRRTQGIDILWPLLRYMTIFMRDYSQLDYILCCVNPSAVDFYEGYLAYTRLGEKPEGVYDFVEGAPAVGYFMDLKQYREIYKRIYLNTLLDSNLSLFFDGAFKKYERYPDSIEECLVNAPEYLWRREKSANRLWLNLSLAAFNSDKERSPSIVIENISRDGICLRQNKQTTEHKIFKINLCLKNQEVAKLTYKQVWQKPDGSIGAQCINATKNWFEMWSQKSNLQNLTLAG